MALSAIAACLVLAGRASAADPDLPIVDVHIHYSDGSWAEYTPAAVIGILDGAGVVLAFVSSTPDEGTVRLHQAAPDRIVPVLRPYRASGQLTSWHADPAVLPYLEERLARGIYRGIGEFHLYGAAEAGSPVVRGVVELAARHGVFLHCHCDPEAIAVLAAVRSDVRVLWAHAGWAGPGQVERLLDTHPGLYVELAMRPDVAGSGTLDPDWRGVFLRYPQRFMVGTDTWTSWRWASLPAVQSATRAWLRELPPEVAQRIASGNARELAGRDR